MSFTYTPEFLIAGNYPIQPDTVTIPAAEALGGVPRGALLGKITADDTYILSLSAAGDGSEVPRVILAEEVPVGYVGDIVVPVYRTGEFSADAVTFGADHTVESTKEVLADLNIYIHTTQYRS